MLIREKATGRLRHAFYNSPNKSRLTVNIDRFERKLGFVRIKHRKDTIYLYVCGIRSALVKAKQGQYIIWHGEDCFEVRDNIDGFEEVK